MTRTLFAMNEGRLVSIPVIDTRPSGPLHGEDISFWWENGQFSGAMAGVLVGGNGADGVLTSPTGGSEGVELWGYRINKWGLISSLRDGRDITVYADGRGYWQAVNVIGIFRRLAVVGSGVAAIASIAPIDEWEK